MDNKKFKVFLIGGLILFTGLMFVVAILYFISTRISKKQISDMGYVPVN